MNFISYFLRNFLSFSVFSLFLVRTLGLFGALFITNTAFAEEGDSLRRGAYLGMDIGLWLPRQLESNQKDSDVPTNCDQHLLSDDGSRPEEMLNLDDDACARGQDKWENSFDLGLGIVSGIHWGYGFNSIRLEGEYFHRNQKGHPSHLNLLSGGKESEFSQTSERISDLQGHHFFANFYYDFPVHSKFIPYFGLGLGLAYVEMNYSVKFVRNLSANLIKNLGRNPEAAGTASLSEDRLFDTLYGYQIIGGIDYALSEKFYVGFKVRYGDYFNAFEDSNTYDLLRSHNSTIAPNSTEEPVVYEIEVEDFDFLSLSFNIKYFF